MFERKHSKTNGSLTEVYFLGFSWGFKEGVHRNTHKACSGQHGRPARDRKGTLKNRRVLPSKSKFKSRFMWGEKFFTVFVEPMAFACVFLLFENAARKKCFYTWSSRVFFHLNTLVGSKKLFCWLIFVQWIEWNSRINESNEIVESMNRVNESNQ